MRRLPLIIMPLLFVAMIVLSRTNATDSPHGNRLKYSCEVCHTTSGWVLDENNTFVHTETGFQLTGQHLFVDCRECHPTLVFDDAGTNCMDCHADMHEQTLGTHCDRCHTTDSWLVTNILEIHQTSRFPLLGAHSLADCFDCHRTESMLRFEPLGIACFDCHNDEYQSARFPDHVAAGYSTSCEDCHNINAYEWSSTGINHNFFPLTGGHDIADCAACHTAGDYAAISPVCFSCHEADYTATTNPNHGTSDFSIDCQLCHTTSIDWRPATMDHSFFPLEGAHQINDCLECHTTGNYAAASPVCLSCHEADYNATTDPNHAGTGFSTDCMLCHTTLDSWKPSTFEHNSYFPIYSGRHQGEWNSCSDCHTNASNYNIFSCIECHEHNKSETDSNHNDVNDYVYTSTSCYECHPRGEGD